MPGSRAVNEGFADHAPVGLFSRGPEVARGPVSIPHAAEVQVPGTDQSAVRHDHRALDPVLKLADIARPAPFVDCGKRVWCETCDNGVHLGSVASDEMLGEKHLVARPVGQ